MLNFKKFIIVYTIVWVCISLLVYFLTDAASRRTVVLFPLFGGCVVYLVLGVISVSSMLVSNKKQLKYKGDKGE